MTDQPLDSGPCGGEAPDAIGVVLEKLLSNRRVIADAEVEKLKLVVEWIVVNEVDPDTHDVGPLVDRATRTAGEGSPYVTEFGLMEFAAVLGMTTDSGGSYVCAVAELRYRLPHLWDQVEAGKLPAWRALNLDKLDRRRGRHLAAA